MHETIHFDSLSLDTMLSTQKDLKYLEEVAKSRGLVGKLVEVKFSPLDDTDAFTSNMDGVYWITAKHQQDLDRVLESIRLVEQGLREPYQSLIYQKILDEKFSEALDTRINIAPLTDSITSDDLHAFIDECFHRINDMEIIWNSFQEFNLIPPEKVSYTTLAVLKDNLIQRFKPYLTNAEYTTMTNLAKKNCENAIERFEKRKELVVPVNMHQPHFVDKRYFIENRIDYFNENVSPEFIEYMQRRWDKVPHFYMSVDKKPCIDSINHKASALDQSTRYVLYECAVPKKFSDMFNAWKIGFWAENCDWPVCSLNELGSNVIGKYDANGVVKDSNNQIRMLAITVEDSWTFFPELAKTGVKVAIYQGELKQPVTTNPMYFLYNTKDSAVVSKVMAMTREQAIRESWFTENKGQVKMKARLNDSVMEKQMEEKRRIEMKKDFRTLTSMQLCDKYLFTDEDLDYAKKCMPKKSYQELYSRVRKEQRGVDDVVLDYGVSPELGDSMQVYGANEKDKQTLAKITERLLKDRKKNKGLDI